MKYSYLLFKIVFFTFIDKSQGNFFISLFTIQNCIDFFLFNYNPIADHLWYLFAILYILIIAKYFYKRMLDNKFMIVVIILLIINICLGRYSFFFFDKSIPIQYTRNFLFFGVPFFTIGMKMREFPIKISNVKLKFLFIVSTILLIIEYSILKYVSVERVGDVFITLPMLVISIFAACIKQSNVEKNDKIKELVSLIGRKYSSNIYVFHPLIEKIVYIIMIKIGIGTVFSYIGAIIVFFSTLIILIILNIIKERYCKKIK